MLFYGIICINNGSLWLFSSGTGGQNAGYLVWVRLGSFRFHIGFVSSVNEHFTEQNSIIEILTTKSYLPNLTHLNSSPTDMANLDF